MRVLFLMTCVFILSIGACFAEGENLANADGSFCEEGGKTPASVVVKEDGGESTGTVRE